MKAEGFFLRPGRTTASLRRNRDAFDSRQPQPRRNFNHGAIHYHLAFTESSSYCSRAVHSHEHLIAGCLTQQILVLSAFFFLFLLSGVWSENAWWCLMVFGGLCFFLFFFPSFFSPFPGKIYESYSNQPSMTLVVTDSTIAVSVFSTFNYSHKLGIRLPPSKHRDHNSHLFTCTLRSLHTINNSRQTLQQHAALLQYTLCT